MAHPAHSKPRMCVDYAEDRLGPALAEGTGELDDPDVERLRAGGDPGGPPTVTLDRESAGDLPGRRQMQLLARLEGLPDGGLGSGLVHSASPAGVVPHSDRHPWIQGVAPG